MTERMVGLMELLADVGFETTKDGEMASCHPAIQNTVGEAEFRPCIGQAVAAL
jgi:hypothetical protein